MWYNVNFNKLGDSMLPTFLRKPNFKAFVTAVILPLDKLYYKWQTNRLDNLYKVEHNAQICYFQKALNDGLDPQQRRIFITDANMYEREYLYTTIENYPRYFYLPDEEESLTYNKMYLHEISDYGGSNVDFIVHVPREIYEAQYYQLIASIDLYRLGGKRYKIIIIGDIDNNENYIYTDPENHPQHIYTTQEESQYGGDTMYLYKETE